MSRRFTRPAIQGDAPTADTSSMTTTETDPRILAAFTDWRLARIRAEVTYLEVLRAYYQDHAAGFVTKKQRTAGMLAAWLEKTAAEQAADEALFACGGIA